MSTFRKPYTPEENTIILNCVANSPDNIKKALIQAGEKIGRTYTSVQWQYYMKLTKPNFNNKANAKFITVGKKSYNINRKVTRDGERKTLQDPTPHSIPIWRRLLKLFS